MLDCIKMTWGEKSLKHTGELSVWEVKLRVNAKRMGLISKQVLITLGLVNGQVWKIR